MADDMEREEPEVEGHKKKRLFEELPADTEGQGLDEDDEPEVEAHKKRR